MSGRFVWHDLMTTDVEAAKAFYGEVLGWKTQPFGDEGDYTMFCVGEQPIGGVALLPEKAKRNGAPPHWMGHVEVADLAATIAQATEQGGQVAHEETIPSVGKLAITRDPQGAVLSYFQPEQGPMAEIEIVPGKFSWNELNTTDWEGAWSYYSALFGWCEHARMEMGPEMGAYFMYQVPDGKYPLGGMSNVAKVHGFPPHWLYYVEVADIADAVGRVKSHGGEIKAEMDVPGGKIAHCLDPQGVFFALHQGEHK